MRSPLHHVLYVEDDEDLRALTSFGLSRMGGLEVRAFASGHDAIAAAADFLPDLILLDIHMPEMDGPTTLAGLRRLPDLSQVPAIFLTGSSSEEEAARLRVQCGAIAVIAKPYDPMSVHEQIGALWSEVAG